MNRRGFFGLVGKLFGVAVAAKVLPKPSPFTVMVYEPLVVTEGFFDANCRKINDGVALIHFSNRSGIKTVEHIEWHGDIGFGETVEG